MLYSSFIHSLLQPDRLTILPRFMGGTLKVATTTVIIEIETQGDALDINDIREKLRALIGSRKDKR